MCPTAHFVSPPNWSLQVQSSEGKGLLPLSPHSSKEREEEERKKREGKRKIRQKLVAEGRAREAGVEFVYIKRRDVLKEAERKGRIIMEEGGEERE